MAESTERDYLFYPGGQGVVFGIQGPLKGCLVGIASLTKTISPVQTRLPEGPRLWKS